MALVRLIYLGFLENFGPPIFIYVYMFFAYVSSFFDVKLILDKWGASKAPPTHYPINFRSTNNMKNMQKYIKMYKDGGAKIFQKSYIKQPNQGHQPWQSNSLTWKVASLDNFTKYSTMGS